MTDPTPDAPARALPDETTPPAWTTRLLELMEMGLARPDLAGVAALAGQARAAHPQDPDAGTSAAFIAGYAAGLAEGTGQADFARAHRASLRALERLIVQSRAEQQEDPA